MKIQEAPEYAWVGIDLHVHTPASADYRGNRDEVEYLNIIRRANQFGASADHKKAAKKQPRNPIGAVAFTDHNSVEGFRKYRQVVADTEKVATVLRTRDPSNPLVPQLELDLQTLRSVRVLMGVEIKANPGIHTILIFAESVEPDNAVAFLEDAYQMSYDKLAGDPTPAARWTVKETLDKISETFGEKSFVMFPHVDSNGGVYEDLKDFAQVRIAALTHPVVRALSFNKQETREKLANLFGQPDYQRQIPLALVQSSDFHGDEGSAIGEPRTEVSVRDGKPTFKNLRDAFRDRTKIKCSIDFVAAEYENVTRLAQVIRFQSEQSYFGFKNVDHDAVAAAVCAMLNSGGGMFELEGNISGQDADTSEWSVVRDSLIDILATRLDPSVGAFFHRAFRFSPSKVRLLFNLPPTSRLHTSNGHVYILDGTSVRQASAFEIESTVSKKIRSRFGIRLQGSLEDISENAKLLSKLPRGIPILLDCQRKLRFGLSGAFEFDRIEPASDKGAEIEELVDELFESTSEETTFGLPDGNATLLRSEVPPRFREHYLRFSIFRADIEETLASRCSWGKVDQPAIVVHTSGGIGLVEPGYIISNGPALLIRLAPNFQKHVFPLLGWLKSSFFVWYCAVHLGNANPLIEMQYQSRRIPLPNFDEGFYNELSDRVRGLLSDESSLLSEVMRLKKKGTLDKEYQEKLRHRHNDRAAAICLAIDKDVYRFLGLANKDARFVGRTLREMDLTDYGFSDEAD